MWRAFIAEVRCEFLKKPFGERSTSFLKKPPILGKRKNWVYKLNFQNWVRCTNPPFFLLSRFLVMTMSHHFLTTRFKVTYRTHCRKLRNGRTTFTLTNRHEDPRGDSEEIRKLELLALVHKAIPFYWPGNGTRQITKCVAEGRFHRTTPKCVPSFCANTCIFFFFFWGQEKCAAAVRLLSGVEPIAHTCFSYVYVASHFSVHSPFV